MIKVLLKNSSDFIEMNPKDLEKKFGFTWLTELRFEKVRFLFKALKKSQTALRKKELSIKEKWLGVRFQKQITGSKHPKISIRYVDDDFGYGVFAEEDILSGSFIGEYTGMIRKRKGRKDRKNDYCFEYTLGDWVYNPFIIDAKERGNFTRFINHSDEPNLESLSVFADQVMHIIFIASRPVQKGTQLCYHYGDYFWKKRPKDKKLPLNT